MRSRSFRITLAAVTAALALSLSFRSTASAAGSPLTDTARAAVGGSAVGRVVALTNAQRTAHGCRALSVNRTLTTAAAAHSRDMAVRGFFGHVNPSGLSPADRISARGYRYSRLAENIAAGYASPDAVVNAWMHSPGHRANILNCSLTQIGVGYASGGPYGSYWTQDFATRR